MSDPEQKDGALSEGEGGAGQKTKEKRECDTDSSSSKRRRMNHGPTPYEQKVARTRDLSYKLQTLIRTLHLQERHTLLEEDDDLSDFEDDVIIGDIEEDEMGDLVQKYLLEMGIEFEQNGAIQHSNRPADREDDSDSDTGAGTPTTPQEPVDYTEDDPFGEDLVGDDAEFITEISRTLALEECHDIIKRAFGYFERVYKYRRREHTKATPGEEPLAPESIPFTRMLHKAVIGIALPVILGQKAYEMYGVQIANSCDLITGYKAAILIMARGNGKTMGMIDIIPFMILFQRRYSHYKIFLVSPAQALVKETLDMIKTQVRIHVRAQHGLSFATERPNVDSSTTLDWNLSDGRRFTLYAAPATENQVRGKHPNLMIVDEARNVPDVVIEDAIAPIITDQGSLVFYISTPADAGTVFDTQVRLALSQLRDPNCPNPVMYPLIMTLVCEEHQKCDVPSKCMCGMCYLQPWKPISMIRPVIDAKRAAGKISSLECEELGLPPTLEGSCFNRMHISAFERADPTSQPPDRFNPTIVMSIDPTMNGSESDLAIVSKIIVDKGNKEAFDTGVSFAVSMIVYDLFPSLEYV